MVKNLPIGDSSQLETMTHPFSMLWHVVGCNHLIVQKYTIGSAFLENKTSIVTTIYTPSINHASF